MKIDSDRELIHEIQSGNISAFETLVRRYQSKLLRVANRIVHSNDMSEDVVQETFIKLYQTIDRVDTTKPFSPYLFSMVKNNAISYLRKKKNHVPLSHAEHIASRHDVIGELETKEQNARIHEALTKLPHKYTRVLTLRYFEDVSYEKIGRMLHIPINTVRTHLKRGKKLLEGLLRI